MSEKKSPGQIAVIYARYSSHQQRDVSIEQQVNACKKYAAENNLTVIRVYDDHAMTGTNDNRPAFQQMIKDSASRAFQYVIVYTLDRFSRDRYDSAIHKHTLKEHGVKVLSAMENLQDNPVGALMESILEGFAEYYSKELAQKTMRGQRSNAEKCMASGATAYGFRIGKDKRYEPDPVEAPIVVEIFHRVSEHESFKDIIDDLNRRGYLTKSGTPWNKSSFNRLLTNEKYTGVFIYSDIRIDGGMPVLIDKATFDSVQSYIGNKPNARGTKKRHRDTGTYLLTGKLYCGHCKSPMVGTSGTGKSGALHFYYACKNRLAHTCKKKNVSRDYIEKLIAEKLQSVIFAPEMAEYIADQSVAYLAANEETDEMRMLKARISDLEKEQANTLKAIRQGVVVNAVQQMLVQIESDLESNRSRLALATERAKNNITKAEILSLLDMYRTGDIASKSYQEALIDAFLIRAYLYDDKLKLVFNYTAEGSSEYEIPFDIDDIPDSECSDSVSDESSFATYTNTGSVVFTNGVFILVAELVC